MCLTLFHGFVNASKLGRRLPMRSSSRKLLTRCTVDRIVFNYQIVWYNTAVAYIDRSIEQFDSRSQMYNHFSVEGHPGVRRFDSSSYVSPLRLRKRKPYSDLQTAGSLQHWFKNWQDKRIQKLTASTFGGAIGLWRQRRVELWLEKLGAKEPFSGNLATWWSNIKEKEAIATYKRITQNNLSFPTFQVYPEERDDWIAASPDGLVENIVYGLPSRGVLEIKCPYFVDMRLATPWKRVPLYYVPQAQGLMEIMDRDWMDFYVWTPGGSSLFRIYRDREYWEVLKLALADFWLKHVLPAKELCDKYQLKNPFMELPLLRPAPRHQYCEYIIRESRRIVDASPLLLSEMGGNIITVPFE